MYAIKSIKLYFFATFILKTYFLEALYLKTMDAVLTKRFDHKTLAPSPNDSKNTKKSIKKVTKETDTYLNKIK